MDQKDGVDAKPISRAMWGTSSDSDTVEMTARIQYLVVPSECQRQADAQTSITLWLHADLQQIERDFFPVLTAEDEADQSTYPNTRDCEQDALRRFAVACVAAVGISDHDGRRHACYRNAGQNARPVAVTDFEFCDPRKRDR